MDGNGWVDDEVDFRASKAFPSKLLLSNLTVHRVTEGYHLPYDNYNCLFCLNIGAMLVTITNSHCELEQRLGV